jgi:hypothetical protein
MVGVAVQLDRQTPPLARDDEVDTELSDLCRTLAWNPRPRR